MQPRSLMQQITELAARCRAQEQAIQQRAGLSASGLRCIRSIQPGEVLSSRELSGRVELSASRGSRLIDALVRRGFLTRRTDPSDRRAVRVALTEAGVRLQREVVDHFARCETRVRAQLDPHALDTVQRGLDLLQEAFST